MNIHMRDSAEPETADMLIYEAITALGAPSSRAHDSEPIEAPDEVQVKQGRQLARVMDSLTSVATSDCFSRWRTYYTAASATLPIEDDLYVVKRELRRAHAMLAALQQQQARR